MKISLLALALLLFVSCSHDVRDMKMSELSKLSEEKRTEVLRELNGEEMAYIMQAGIGLAFADSVTKQKVANSTIGEVIERMRKVSEKAK